MALKNLLALCVIAVLLQSCEKEKIIVTAEEKTFPVNPEFERYLFDLGIDRHMNGLLRHSDVQKVDSLNFNRNYSIKSLKEIEHFENLRSLVIFDIKLDSLDLSKNTKLQYLSCISIDAEGEGRSLAFLNIKNCPALTYLNCSSNLISFVDLSENPALRELHCGDNPNLTKLDLSKNSALEILNCGLVEHLTILDLSKNPNLNTVLCPATGLNELDMNMQSGLKRLDCRETGISNLKLKAPENLEELYITGSKISAIDFNIFPKLHSLAFGSNLTRFDLKPLSALKLLDCFGVTATTLDLSTNLNLERLSLRLSAFKTLDLRHNNMLQTIFFLELDNLTSLDLRNLEKLNSFGSSYNDNLKTICVKAFPDPSNMQWFKDNWTSYVICK